MKKNIIILLSIVCLSPLVLAAKAQTTQTETVKMIIAEMEKSAKFNKSMVCLGISEKEKLNYLKQFEESYLYCVNKSPPENAQVTAFLECLKPKLELAIKSLGISDSKLKKCETENP